jgi:hypothetical protein
MGLGPLSIPPSKRALARTVPQVASAAGPGVAARPLHQAGTQSSLARWAGLHVGQAGTLGK